MGGRAGLTLRTVAQPVARSRRPPEPRWPARFLAWLWHVLRRTSLVAGVALAAGCAVQPVDGIRGTALVQAAPGGPADQAQPKPLEQLPPSAKVATGQWVSWPPSGRHGTVVLRAWWSPVPGSDTVGRPAVVLLHGCGGMLNTSGDPSARMRDYARLLNAQGWHTLAVDSLTPRGETELCTQRASGRRVKVSDRALDAHSALGWLARQPGVDASRLALLGWSNGGSTLLAATDARSPIVASHVRQAPHPLRVAVAFYPGCKQAAASGYQPISPTWLLLGEDDDWTPAAECLPLASDTVHIRSWPGAGHGFDGTAPVRHRPEVPNGVKPGQGVHVGGHPQARQEAQALLLQVLSQAFAQR